MRPREVFCATALGLFCVTAQGETVFRCVDDAGKVSYRDAPCRAGSAQGPQDRVLRIDLPPGKPKPAASAPVRKPVAAKPPPREALIRLFYDLKNAPIEHSQAQMEALIGEAARVWSSGCKVTLEYGGTAAYTGPGGPERVVIRWNADYFTASHPAMAGMHFAGTGSLEDGIALLPRVSDERLRYVLIHELGHVLGVRHRHTDPASVMSYLSTPDLSRPIVPSPGDFLACNLAMKQRFGIDFDAPPDAANDAAAAMSDREALQRKYAAPRTP